MRRLGWRLWPRRPMPWATTGEIQEPVLGRTAKLNTLMRLCWEKNLPPSDVLAVGDGANDIKMIKAAGLGVAFHGSESLKNQANACINHGDLTALLYIQGFYKSEFMHSGNWVLFTTGGTPA